MFPKLFLRVVSGNKKVLQCWAPFCSVSVNHDTIDNSNITCSESEQKILKVAVIGMPNAGKSTFINSLMDRKVCAASAKVHTTKNKALAIFTEHDSQIIFVDTPGIVTAQEKNRFDLGRSFMKDGKNSLSSADLIGVLHDVSNTWTRDKLDIKIIKLLEMVKQKPSFLVLNKIDILTSKRTLLDLTRQLTDNCLDGKPIPGGKPLKYVDEKIKGWAYFSNIFMVSALTGDGLGELRNYLVNSAKPGKWVFPEHIWTDQTAETLIVNSVQAKLLDFLPQEIPYQLKASIEYFDISDNGVIKTVVIVRCPTLKKAKLVAGAADGKIRQITESVQRDLQETFQNYVRIKIVVEGPKE